MNGKDALLFTCWVLTLPFRILGSFLRLRNHIEFLRLATATQILCACGAPISLVGLWRCSCTFTYRGHLLQICPLCGKIPRICRCYACGLTTKLPEPYYDQIN
jgi:hypothetical protein